MNRRTLVAGSVSLLAMPSVFSAALAATSAINVGVIMPLSGANAQFGINSRNGIELVADEINAAGGIKELGGAKINLDATPLINKLRTSGAQAVFPVSYLNDSLLIIRTMRQQRITIPAIGGAAG